MLSWRHGVEVPLTQRGLLSSTAWGRLTNVRSMGCQLKPVVSRDPLLAAIGRSSRNYLPRRCQTACRCSFNNRWLAAGSKLGMRGTFLVSSMSN